MKTKNPTVDRPLSELLDSLRHRVRRYVVCDSVLLITAVLLSAFWIGLALDWLPLQVGGTEMPMLARTILLVLTIAIVTVIFATMLLGRLLRRLPDDSLALLIERQYPAIGGRLVTAVQLNEPGRSGDSHSLDLLRQVHDQAAAAVGEVDPNRVFRWAPLLRKGLVVGPLACCALLFAILSPDAFGLAVSRLTLFSDDPWPRRAHLEMVGVELPVVSASEDESIAPELVQFTNRSIRLPRGSSGTLRIRARADDSEVPTVCTVLYRSDDGTRGQSNMRRVGRVVDGYQAFILDGPPLSDLNESLMLSVRGLDDRLDDYRIEAITPPAITGMRVVVRYPEYLRGEGSSDVDLETEYQAGLRLREGSQVTLLATSSEPLGDVEVLIKTDAGDHTPTAFVYSDDRREVRLAIDDFSTAMTIRLVPHDIEGISAQAAYRYFVGIVLDEPPELELQLQGIGSAVTPTAKLPLKATAVDDYGVKNLAISITPSNEAEQDSVTATTSPGLNRDGQAEAHLDLRDLVANGQLPELVPGGAINLFAEATDAYDLGDPHLTRSEVYRLQIVTPEKLLALLERRELALRARLEQTISETRNLRDTLDVLRRGFRATGDGEPDESERTRQMQLRRLRSQQSGLQANKTSEELSGIATSLDDILEEMINNRVDSIDRRERIGKGVRDPIQQIVKEPLQKLRDQIREIEKSVADPAIAEKQSVAAVESAEEVLLRLTEVLEKMLDLESYNEILDMVRELIDDQQELLDDTILERKKKVLELFK